MSTLNDDLDSLKISKASINKILGQYYQSLKKFIDTERDKMLFKIKIDEKEVPHFTTTATCFTALLNLNYYLSDNKNSSEEKSLVIKSINRYFLNDSLWKSKEKTVKDGKIWKYNCYKIVLILPFLLKILLRKEFEIYLLESKKDKSELFLDKNKLIKIIEDALLILIKNFVYNNYSLYQWYYEIEDKKERKNFISKQKFENEYNLPKKNTTHSFIEYWAIKSLVLYLQYFELKEKKEIETRNISKKDVCDICGDKKNVKEKNIDFLMEFRKIINDLNTKTKAVIKENKDNNIDKNNEKIKNSINYINDLQIELNDFIIKFESGCLFNEDCSYIRNSKDNTPCNDILGISIIGKEEYSLYTELENKIKKNEIEVKLSDDNKEELDKRIKEILSKINNIKSILGNFQFPEKIIQRIVIKKFLSRIKETITNKVNLHIAYSNIGYLEFDPNQLAYLISMLNQIDGYVNQRLLSTALKIIFENRKKHGGWIPGKAFSYSQDGDGEMTLYEMEPLLTILANFYKTSELFEHLNEINDAIQWLYRNRIDMGDETFGWVFSFPGGKEARSWVTAIVYRILEYYSKFISRRIRRLILNKYSVEYRQTFPILAKDYYYCNDELEELITKEVVPKLKNGEFQSLLLFGPPGTGKTSFGYVISDETQFPLILLAPGDFLVNGFDKIAGRANEIFNDLLMLEEAIIFIDEIDQLVLGRKEKQENDDNNKSNNKLIYNKSQPKWEERLMTTAMLNLLDKLNKYTKICFIASTNHIDKIDKAIRRRGRFHYNIAITPYCYNKRKRIICDFLQKNIEEEKRKDIILKDTVKKIAKETIGFVYKDIEEILNKHKGILIARKTLERKDLENTLEKFSSEIIGEVKAFDKTIDTSTFLNFLQDEFQYQNFLTTIDKTEKQKSFCGYDVSELLAACNISSDKKSDNRKTKEKNKENNFENFIKSKIEKFEEKK